MYSGRPVNGRPLFVQQRGWDFARAEAGPRTIPARSATAKAIKATLRKRTAGIIEATASAARMAPPLRGRLMVGRLALDQVVKVRILAPQPFSSPAVVGGSH